MDVDTAKYFGYALQLLLVLVLVISLACKSWALLIICLICALVLLSIVCYQLINRTSGFKSMENVGLLKKSAVTMDESITPTASMTSTTLMTPMTDLSPMTYVPPILQHLTRDEQAAMHLMSMTDRGVNMHQPIRKDFNQYIVPQSQGMDLHPYTNAYMVQASEPTSLPVHLDEMHPDNPMNSLSYLKFG